MKKDKQGRSIHWAKWSEVERYLHFKRIWKVLGGPNANLRSTWEWLPEKPDHCPTKRQCYDCGKEIVGYSHSLRCTWCKWKLLPELARQSKAYRKEYKKKNYVTPFERAYQRLIGGKGGS